MKLLLNLFTTLGLFASLSCNERLKESEVNEEAESLTASKDTQLTIEEIKAMPKGFEVVHTPRDVAAVETGNPDSPYRWEHEETVIPQVDNLMIQEFGYIVVVNSEPRLHSFARDGKPYDRADFNRFFDSQDERLKKGKKYTRTDWTENEFLEKSEMTPYFVGSDDAGQLYSGYSRMTKLPQLKESENKAEMATPRKPSD